MSNDYLVFWGTFIVLTAMVLYCDRKYNMLRDNGTQTPRPYSFARVQLAWWTVIVLASFITIIIRRDGAPTFDSSTLYLIGISSATSVGATLIDLSDQNNPNVNVPDVASKSFFMDILSDKNGINVHRFQTVIFNLVFGVWFIYEVHCNLPNHQQSINNIMPIIASNNLILLGVSSGLYAALKTTENKQVTSTTAPPAGGPTATTPVTATPAIIAVVVPDEAKPQG